LAPRGVSEKSHPFRPITNGLIAFSTSALLMCS
jgi:hypothetical protein